MKPPRNKVSRKLVKFQLHLDLFSAISNRGQWKGERQIEKVTVRSYSYRIESC